MKQYNLDINKWKMGVPFSFGYDNQMTYDGERSEYNVVRETKKMPIEYIKKYFHDNIENDKTFNIFHQGWLTRFFSQDHGNYDRKEIEGKWINDIARNNKITMEEAYKEYIRPRFYEILSVKANYISDTGFEYKHPDFWENFILAIEELHCSYSLFEEINLDSKEKFIEEHYFTPNFFEASFEFRWTIDKIEPGLLRKYFNIPQDLVNIPSNSSFKTPYEIECDGGIEFFQTFHVIFSLKVPLATYYIYNNEDVDEDYLRNMTIKLGFHPLNWDEVNNPVKFEFEKYKYNSLWEAFFKPSGI